MRCLCGERKSYTVNSAWKTPIETKSSAKNSNIKTDNGSTSNNNQLNTRYQDTSQSIANLTNQGSNTSTPRRPQNRNPSETLINVIQVTSSPNESSNIYTSEVNTTPSGSSRENSTENRLTNGNRAYNEDDVEYRSSKELLPVPSGPKTSSVSTASLSSDRKSSTTLLTDGETRQSSIMENEIRRRSGVQVSMPSKLEEIAPGSAKTPEDQERIKKAIEGNEFLNKIISGERLQDIINAMQIRTVTAKQKIIKQGDKGSEMFVSKEGKYRILIKGKVDGEFSDTRVFGELAILYNAKRLASIQAVTDGIVWVLTREVYQKIVIKSNLKEQDENLRFLQNVQSLNVVDIHVLRQVSNLLKPEFFAAGTVIIRQGDKGDKFYIIRAGTVTISKIGEGVLGKLGKGQCFGEMALQKEDTRQATVTAEAPGVECLTLTRADFINHFGDVEIPKIEIHKPNFTDEAQAEYQEIELTDLKIIGTLGVGGFGRAELVQYQKKKSLVFALKYIKKVAIVHQGQQEHIKNEKIIQMNCRSPFIVRLYRTYKDNKYVYFLMEACLGGDLFGLLYKQKGRKFEERDAKFLSACALEALEYLHNKGIIFRDLKPENLIIDKIGYLKLTDFGFAKRIPLRGKTFTFSGTPEYVAPEVVLNRGHDKAVDYWAFGVLVFELLTGRTPFKTGDPNQMRTYNKILNGIDNVNFRSWINAKGRNLIEKLCRPVPSERLGMQKRGIRDIKEHKWYQGFDWVKLNERQYPSPFKPKLKSMVDLSHIDTFKPDKDYPPEETSGWDYDF